MTDVKMMDEGSVVVLVPITVVAKDWFDTNLPPEPAWCGGIVVEPRYLDAILTGMSMDGLQVSS